MCLAVPAKIISLDGENARVELEGVQRNVNVSMIESPAAGDHVIVHAGFAIQKWDDDDVREYHAIAEGVRAHNR